MLTGRESLLREAPVGADRCRDGDRIDVLVVEELGVVGRDAHRREALVDRVEPLLREVGDGDRLRAGRFVEVTDEVGTPISRTDDGDAKRIHVRGF